MADAQSTLPERPSGTREYYVYALRYPSGEPFYIGCGRDDRIDQHVKAARKGGRMLHHRIIRAITERGAPIRTAVLFECHDRRPALKVEASYIRSLRPYGKITNKMTSPAPLIEIHPELTRGGRPPQMPDVAKVPVPRPAKKPEPRGAFDPSAPRPRPSLEMQILIGHCLARLADFASTMPEPTSTPVPVGTASQAMVPAPEGYLFAIR
jgi:hypothetical protein